MQEAGNHNINEEDPTYSALDEDDFQTVTIENELGCDMHLKKVDDDVNVVEQIHPGGRTYVWIPPPRFSDRLKVADESREARCYVVIQIIEAKVAILNFILLILPALYC